MSASPAAVIPLGQANPEQQVNLMGVLGFGCWGDRPWLGVPYGETEGRTLINTSEHPAAPWGLRDLFLGAGSPRGLPAWRLRDGQTF